MRQALQFARIAGRNREGVEMRGLMLVTLVALAGCAQPLPPGQLVVPTRPPMTPEQIVANRASEGARRAALERHFEEERIAAADPRRIRDQQAADICDGRGQTVAAQPQYTGPGLAGAIESAAQTSQSGRAVAQICWQTYQSTGIMPTY
jgi:hypothetical protein